MTKDKIIQLKKQLYPTGRAFRISEGSNIEKLHEAFAESESAMYDDALSILDQILPDNDNFTEDDASDWERRLGIITSVGATLTDRKLAIIRKMNHPGTIPARQSHDYLEQQLQNAGFDVYVHENIPEQSIYQVLSSTDQIIQLGDAQMGDAQLANPFTFYDHLYECIQLGDVQMGDAQLNQCFYNQKVVNHIDYQKDIFFNIGDNYRSTFFIGGGYLGEFADVESSRREEFRQLILRIKPVQTVGFLLIDYV